LQLAEIKIQALNISDMSAGISLPYTTIYDDFEKDNIMVENIEIIK
jgi:hypothetical protein